LGEKEGEREKLNENVSGQNKDDQSEEAEGED